MGIHEKNQKQKISGHCPFKYFLVEEGGTKNNGAAKTMCDKLSQQLMWTFANR